MAFSYYKQLSINTGFSGGTHTNFPAVIKLTTDSDLNTHVTNASGYDIAFFTDSSLSTQIPHELRTYSGGSLVAWFKIPSFTSGTNIYMAYGDSGISSDQSSTDTWNSNYKLVIHGRTATDATVNAADITNNGVTAGASGKIDQALDFESSQSDYLSIADSAALDITGAHTVQAWVNFESNGGNLGGVYYKSALSMWEAASSKTINFGHNGGVWYKNHAKSLNEWQYGQKTITPSNSTWYMVHGTWDGTTVTNQGTTVYWNGADSGENGGIGTTDGGDAVQTNNAAAIIGGKAISGTDYLWDGLIEEFRLSSVDLGADWIATEYAMMNDNASFWTVGAEQAASTEPTYKINIAGYTGVRVF